MKYYFLTMYLGLLSKVHLQSNPIYKKLDKMLTLINRQLKFIKEDKIFFCHFKPSQFKKMPSYKTLRRDT